MKFEETKAAAHFFSRLYIRAQLVHTQALDNMQYSQASINWLQLAARVVRERWPHLAKYFDSLAQEILEA